MVALFKEGLIFASLVPGLCLCPAPQGVLPEIRLLATYGLEPAGEKLAFRGEGADGKPLTTTPEPTDYTKAGQFHEGENQAAHSV